uniref:G patch domain-containing protein 4 n=1 Tax=Tabanus bromius TaxID=304241 RepID=A0A0K8TLV7_TABBR
MDFGKNILEKYGWKEGDGLGKDSNGITKPLRPSYKFDKQGLGADPSEEFNNNWWERTFNEASKNINIQKDGEKISFTVDGSTEITTKSYSVKKLKNNMKGKKYKNFLKSSILSKSNEVAEKDSVDMDSLKLPEIPVLNDNEIVAACGGRTAHKGARHGLTLSGKLARIKKQDEKMMAVLNKANEKSTSEDLNKSDELKQDPESEDCVPLKSKSKKRKERKKFNLLSRSIDSLGLESSEDKDEDHETEKPPAKCSKSKKRKYIDEVQKVEDKTEKDKIESLLSTTDYQKAETKKKRRKQNKVYHELSQIIVGWKIESNSPEKHETIVEETKPIEPCKQVKKRKKKGNKNKNKDSFETYRHQALINELTDSDLEANSSMKDPVHKIKATQSLRSAKALKKRKKKKNKKLNKKLKGIVLEDCDVVIT